MNNLEENKMRISIVCVGKIKEKYLILGIDSVPSFIKSTQNLAACSFDKCPQSDITLLFKL